jgi:hypothetical protein
MAPEEIIEHIDAENRGILESKDDSHKLTQAQVLSLMNAAAMRGFRFGSESALSVVKSKLVVKYLSEASASKA